MTKFGIYEKNGGATGAFGNFYHNNYMIGIETPVVYDSNYRRVRSANYIDKTPSQSDGDIANIELDLYDQGNVTGATTFNVINGEFIKATLTGNITVTLTSGDYTGQELVLSLVQDGTGNRTVTWPSNFKKAGGSLTLSTAASARDIIRMRFDGTNWIELSRSLNLS